MEHNLDELITKKQNFISSIFDKLVNTTAAAAANNDDNKQNLDSELQVEKAI